MPMPPFRLFAAAVAAYAATPRHAADDASRCYYAPLMPPPILRHCQFAMPPDTPFRHGATPRQLPEMPLTPLPERRQRHRRRHADSGATPCQIFRHATPALPPPRCHADSAAFFSPDTAFSPMPIGFRQPRSDDAATKRGAIFMIFGACLFFIFHAAALRRRRCCHAEDYRLTRRHAGRRHAFSTLRDCRCRLIIFAVFFSRHDAMPRDAV
jgi:hypothetical protein